MTDSPLIWGWFHCAYRLLKRRLPNFLPNYPLPKALRDCVEAQNDILVVQPCLGEVCVHI